MTDLPVSREKWAKTDVHKASRYFCRWCGAEFPMPHDFYDHLPSCQDAPKEARNLNGNRKGRGR